MFLFSMARILAADGCKFFFFVHHDKTFAVVELSYGVTYFCSYVFVSYLLFVCHKAAHSSL